MNGPERAFPSAGLIQRRLQLKQSQLRTSRTRLVLASFFRSAPLDLDGFGSGHRKWHHHVWKVCAGMKAAARLIVLMLAIIVRGRSRLGSRGALGALLPPIICNSRQPYSRCYPRIRLIPKANQGFLNDEFMHNVLSHPLIAQSSPNRRGRN